MTAWWHTRIWSFPPFFLFAQRLKRDRRDHTRTNDRPDERTNARDGGVPSTNENDPNKQKAVRESVETRVIDRLDQKAVWVDFALEPGNRGEEGATGGGDVALDADGGELNAGLNNPGRKKMQAGRVCCFPRACPAVGGVVPVGSRR